MASIVKKFKSFFKTNKTYKKLVNKNIVFDIDNKKKADVSFVNTCFVREDLVAKEDQKLEESSSTSQSVDFDTGSEIKAEISKTVQNDNFLNALTVGGEFVGRGNNAGKEDPLWEESSFASLISDLCVNGEKKDDRTAGVKNDDRELPFTRIVFDDSVGRESYYVIKDDQGIDVPVYGSQNYHEILLNASKGATIDVETDRFLADDHDDKSIEEALNSWECSSFPYNVDIQLNLPFSPEPDIYYCATNPFCYMM